MRFITGMVTGAIIGTAASMMIPRRNHSAMRRMTKTGRRMARRAGDVFEGLVDFVK
jgi:gas vesicle protein